MDVTAESFSPALPRTPSVPNSFIIFPFMTYIGLSFERLYRNPACGVATLVLNEFKIFALRQTTFASLCSQLQAEV